MTGAFGSCRRSTRQRAFGDLSAASRQACATISSSFKNFSRAEAGNTLRISACMATAISRTASYLRLPRGFSRSQCARRSFSCAWRWTNPACSMRSKSEATVFGSLLINSVRRRCVMPSFSSNVRITVNWSGVTPRCAMRRRKAWFNPYHARRNSSGKRLRSGESNGSSLACLAIPLDLAIRTSSFESYV